MPWLIRWQVVDFSGWPLRAESGLLCLAGLMAPAAVLAAPSAQASEVTITSTGLRPGAIKHVWLIILENKSYDATFSGLNQNTYLWKTLPAQGVLLKNYYGTGHFSMDNYISLVSGQAPEEDTQEDCSVSAKLIGPNSDILHSGSLFTDTNYGQMNSPGQRLPAQRRQRAARRERLRLPDRRPDAVQPVQRGRGELEGLRPGHRRRADAGLHDVPDGPCPTGRPRPAPDRGRRPTTRTPTRPTWQATSRTGVTTFTAAQPDDQFVAKHFPFPWFESLTGAVNPTHGHPAAQRAVQRRHQLRREPHRQPRQPHRRPGPRPAERRHDAGFSWITPDNCSDAHDAVCHGNNLSGAFNANGTPELQRSPIPVRPRVDHAEELHRRPVRLRPVPGVLHPAHRAVARVQAGRPDRRHLRRGIPGLHLHRQQLQQRQRLRPDLGGPAELHRAASRRTRPARTCSAATSTTSRPGRTRPSAPTRRATSSIPGPGNNAFVDRPPVCTQTSPTLVPVDCVPGIVRGRRGQPARRPGPTPCTGGAGLERHRRQLDRRRRHRPGGDRHQHPGELLRRRGDRHRAAVPDHATPARRPPGRSSWSARTAARSTRPAR